MTLYEKGQKLTIRIAPFPYIAACHSGDYSYKFILLLLFETLRAKRASTLFIQDRKSQTTPVEYHHIQLYHLLYQKTETA